MWWKIATRVSTSHFTAPVAPRVLHKHNRKHKRPGHHWYFSLCCVLSPDSLLWYHWNSTIRIRETSKTKLLLLCSLRRFFNNVGWRSLHHGLHLTIFTNDSYNNNNNNYKIFNKADFYSWTRSFTPCREKLSLSRWGIKPRPLFEIEKNLLRGI